MTTEIFIEAIDLTEAVINLETRTVKQKLIASGDSKNMRRYDAEVLQTAMPLFEGVKTYANHPGKTEMKDRPERDVRHITGWLEGVEYRDGALYGVRHFTENEAGNDVWALVKQVVEGKAPASLVGASINAVGKARRDEKSKTVIVESIEHVYSVDDVTTPAAGGGFERLVASADDLTAALVNAMDYDEWVTMRPDYTDRFKSEHRKVRWNEDTRDAKALAEKYRQMFEGAEKAISELQEAHDATLEDLARVKRAVLIQEAIAGVQLPLAWKADVQQQLQESDPAMWSGIIEREIKKAKHAMPRPVVTGAGQRVNVPPPQAAIRESVMPRDDEDAAAWAARVKKGN